MIPLDKFSINRFWETMPTALKYITIVVLLIVSSYFIFISKIKNTHNSEMIQIQKSIEMTYQLINTFDTYKVQQEEYNEEIVIYLENLHNLIGELNNTTNKKFDIILRTNKQISEDILENVKILNSSFEKYSEIYKNDIQKPDFRDQKIKVTPDEKKK
jgi:hypothetical protein